MKIRYIKDHRMFNKRAGEEEDQPKGVALTMIAAGFCEALEDEADAEPAKAIRSTPRNKAVRPAAVSNK